MTTPSADEVYEQFKVALKATYADVDDEVLALYFDDGVADWSLNDEGHVLLGSLSKNDLAKILAHQVVIISQEEDRYLECLEQQSTIALEEIEESDSTDEEKELASELVAAVAMARMEGFSHAVALVHGWALAAVTADEGESVDWDSFLKAPEGESE